MELLCQLNDEGITVITSLHQVQMVQRYFKRAIALRDGKVMFDGAVNDLNEQKLTSIYGSAVEELVTRGHGDFAKAEDLLAKSKTKIH